MIPFFYFVFNELVVPVAMCASQNANCSLFGIALRHIAGCIGVSQRHARRLLCSAMKHEYVGNSEALLSATDSAPRTWVLTYPGLKNFCKFISNHSRNDSWARAAGRLLEQSKDINKAITSAASSTHHSLAQVQHTRKGKRKDSLYFQEASTVWFEIIPVLVAFGFLDASAHSYERDFNNDCHKMFRRRDGGLCLKIKISENDLHVSLAVQGSVSLAILNTGILRIEDLEDWIRSTIAEYEGYVDEALQIEEESRKAAVTRAQAEQQLCKRVYFFCSKCGQTWEKAIAVAKRTPRGIEHLQGLCPHCRELVVEVEGETGTSIFAEPPVMIKPGLDSDYQLPLSA